MDVGGLVPALYFVLRSDLYNLDPRTISNCKFISNHNSDIFTIWIRGGSLEFFGNEYIGNEGSIRVESNLQNIYNNTFLNNNRAVDCYQAPWNGVDVNSYISAHDSTFINNPLGALVLAATYSNSSRNIFVQNGAALYVYGFMIQSTDDYFAGKNLMTLILIKILPFFVLFHFC